jgi:hypothetical protein
MDEYNTGMDQEVKVYFRKIMKSFAAGLLWLLVMVTAGMFFRLGHVNKGWHWYNVLFYGLLVLSLGLLLRYFYKVWKKRE